MSAAAAAAAAAKAAEAAAERDAFEVWHREKAFWTARLESDPRPVREDAPSDVEHDLRTHLWYARQVFELSDINRRLLERWRCAKDYMYRVLFSLAPEHLDESNHLVLEMLKEVDERHRQLMHGAGFKPGSLEETNAVKLMHGFFQSVDVEISRLIEVLNEASKRGLTLEHYAATLEVSEDLQMLKHFFLFMCLAFIPSFVDWLVSGNAVSPPPGVLSGEDLHTYARNIVRPQFSQLMQGANEMVLNRLVYNCRTEYALTVGLANQELPNLAFIEWFADEPSERLFIDAFFVDKQAFVNAESMDVERQRRILQELELRREKTRGAYSTMRDETTSNERSKAAKAAGMDESLHAMMEECGMFDDELFDASVAVDNEEPPDEVAI